MSESAIDLSRNEKQAQFFNDAMAACAGKNEFRFFGYGGAVRGGKTYVTLFILIMLCRKYPRSRWHVIRRDLPDLKATTIPSFEKLAPQGVRIIKDPGNYHAMFPNGSQIFFKAESITQDPELKSFLGLETNGIFIEQAEELSAKMFDKAKERSGSWYIDPMPPAFIFLTFNPTHSWPRAIFYEPFREGTLQSPMYYIPALPSDNPFVTQDQWNAWRTMDSRMYNAMVCGDWDALISDDGRAFWTFKKDRNTGDVPFLPDLPVAHLSFDQNVVPYITLLAAQCEYIGQTLRLRVFREYCLKHPRNKTQAVCEAFVTEYGTQVREVYYYGDASGNKRDTRAADSDYQIAAKALQRYVSGRSNRVQKSNPEIRKRVLFLCAIFEGRIPNIEIVIDRGCHNLIQDLLYIKEDANGGKIKEHQTENGVRFEKYGHTSDALEYLVTTICSSAFRDFERLIR